MKKQVFEPVKVFACFVGCGWLAAILLWFGAPSARPSLFKEGLFLENFGAAAFLVSFLVGIVGILRHWRRKGNLLLAVIPLLGLLAFCDETELILLLNQGRPWLIMGYEIDGIHDVITFSAKVWCYHGSQLTDWLGTGLISAIAGVSFIFRRHYMPWIMTQIRVLPALDFVRFAVIAVATAMLLDLEIWKNDFAFFLEELLETTGAVSLVFGALESHRTPAGDTVSEAVKQAEA